MVENAQLSRPVKEKTNWKMQFVFPVLNVKPGLGYCLNFEIIF